MNSAPVMDSPAAKVAAAPQFPPSGGLGRAATEVPTAPFGDVLQKLSAKPTPETEDIDTETDVTDPLLPIEEPIEEKKAAPDPTIILPLICFCPPPEIQPPPPPPAPTPTISDLITETPIAATPPPVPAIEVKSAELQIDHPETELPETNQPSDLIDTLSPKEKSKLDKSDKPTAKFSAPKTDSPKAIALDPKIFEPIPEKIAQVTLPELPKPIQSTRPEPPPVTHGTLVAQQANAMKNGGKTAEITPAIEQKMPVREVSRRPVTTAARFDNSGLISSAPARISTDFKLEAPAETIPVKSIATVHLVESIRTEVAHLRQIGQSTMSLVLKPDNGTELKLEVSIARDGTIQAQARCERGDFQTLNAQWPQLQQSLAAHGIQMTNLSNTGNQNQNHQHSSENHGNFAGAQNFDRGNQSQNRQQQPAHTFEEELASTTPRFPTPKTFKQTATGTTRRWQSWA